MTLRPPRVVSLDLGETSFWDTPEIAEAQTQERLGVLAAGLREGTGGPLEPGTVAAARRAVLARWLERGWLASSLPNATLVREVQQQLGATLALPLDTLADRYSDAGLAEHPPHFNPEAQELVRTLRGEGIRVVAISNTSRSGRSWREFLAERGDLPFEDVTTSCDLAIRKPDPRIFREAARRIGVTPADVLHVGDRWDRDVVGALASGMAAALYRGLWSHYWNKEEGPPVSPPADTSVPCLDHLTDVRALWARS
jgi:HAD superfamily hydrolase (TIGR01509 family)